MSTPFRRREYEVRPTVAAFGDRSERPWWQSVGLPELRKRASEMSQLDLQVLQHEVKAAIAATQAAIQNVNNTSEHRARAKHALDRIGERRHILAALFTARMAATDCPALGRVGEQRRERHREFTTRARDHLSRGELAEALAVVLDLLEGKHREVDGAEAETVPGSE